MIGLATINGTMVIVAAMRGGAMSDARPGPFHHGYIDMAVVA